MYVMNAEMIHTQFQEQSYINSIDKKIIRARPE